MIEIINKILERFPEMSESEWLEARKTCLGGTDTANLLVPNKYGSPRKIYESKFGPVTPLTNIAPRRGQALEPLVCDLYAEKTGFIIFDVGHRLFRHPLFPYIGGTPDRLVLDPTGRIGGLESKTAIGRNCEQFSIDAPLLYRIQAHTYWLILDAILQDMNIEIKTFWDIAALLDDNHEIFPLNKNSAIRQSIVNVDTKFWNEYYLPQIPPFLDSFDDARDIYKSSLIDSPIEAKKDLLDLIEKRQRLSWTISENSARVKDMETEKKLIENQIITIIKENDIVNYQGQTLMTYKQSASSIEVDNLALKAKYPEIYQSVTFLKEGSRRFNFKDKILKELFG